MTITIIVDSSWLSHPGPLGRILDHVRALEQPAPWTPPAVREPGQDDDDSADLARLLDGMDEPELPQAAAKPSPAPPAAAAVPARPPAARPFDGVPATGRQLYRWAIDRKILPKVNAAGKKYGYGRLVSDWGDDQAVAIYRELTAEPAANGRPC
jgi:hypothetical protein